MTSMIISSVLLFSCCMLISQCRAEVYTESFNNFIDVFNGNYDNIEQHQASNGIINIIQVRVDIVSAPALNAPVIYIEEAINGTVALILVGEVTEDYHTREISVIVYNLTDASLYEPNQFNTANLANYKIEDFEPYGSCPMYVHPLSCQDFRIAWTNCRSNINGVHVELTMEVNCQTIIIVTYLGPPVDYLSKPSVLKRLDKSYRPNGPCIDRIESQ